MTILLNSLKNCIPCLILEDSGLYSLFLELSKIYAKNSNPAARAGVLKGWMPLKKNMLISDAIISETTIRAIKT